MKQVRPSLFSILGGILLLLLAYRLDHWMYVLRHSGSQRESGAGAYLGWMASAYFAALLLAGLSLSWLWFNQRYVQKHPALSLIYVVLGAAMPIYSLAMTAISMRLNSPSFVIYFSIAPVSLTAFASGFIACFGLQRLIFGQSAI